jgi:alkanesulfonate monooxygenase SsuD/methylene tetrahydromethanopterin reductase-like flavin-dependent oxidoreductase (luciferase family)
MQVGLYIDGRNPPQWERPWSTFYGSILERVEEGERLGLDAAWVTEHHMFEDGYLPQPLTLAAAIAARTKRIRVGTAVVLAPLRPAIDIAEQGAVVDLISGGRLELGLGAGYVKPEFRAFGVDAADRYELLEQRTREVLEMWAGDVCTPSPLQTPPPVWIGGMGPRGARMAGRLGVGLLWLKADLLKPYKDALEAAGNDPGSARMAGLANIVIADDPESAWAEIGPHAAYQAGTYGKYGSLEKDDPPPKPATVPVDPDQLRSPSIMPPSFDVVTADEAISRLRGALADIPVAHVYLWASIAGMPDHLVDRHIELLATEVAPAVADLGLPAA